MASIIESVLFVKKLRKKFCYFELYDNGDVRFCYGIIEASTSKFIPTIDSKHTIAGRRLYDKKKNAAKRTRLGLEPYVEQIPDAAILEDLKW